MYPVDTGLIAVFDRSGKANVGHALETAVLHALRRRGAQVHYVRTAAGYEVDFLARDISGAITLIQVCADLDHPDTPTPWRARCAPCRTQRLNGPLPRCCLSACTHPNMPGCRPRCTFSWQAIGFCL